MPRRKAKSSRRRGSARTGGARSSGRGAVADEAPPRDSGEAGIATARLLMNPAGYGFAERQGEPSIFIPAGSVAGAMDGDEVVVSYWAQPRGPEGAVRSVVRRARTRITGILRRVGRRLTVEPDDPRILGRADVIAPFEGDGVGMVVVASIVDYPEPYDHSFTVQVERVLGAPGRLATEEEKILVEHGIEPQRSEAAEAEAHTVASRVHKSDLDGREDLRDLPFMTIDPDDARDFDDAVHVELLGKDPKRARMRAYVAVADVSHYVDVGSAIDSEALIRCFSTYLPSRAIPMLPEPLSSGICSLVPKKDRLAMVVRFEVDTRGRVTEPHLCAAVIRSRVRLTYGQVARELGKAGKLTPVVRRRILALRAVADRLRVARMRRGAIELNVPEVKVILDEDDRERIRDIAPTRSSREMARAYNLIEELMLAANEAVAATAVKYNLPVVFRVHDRPDEERLERFAAVAGFMGVEVEPHELEAPKGVQKLLRTIGKHERAVALNSVLLRSLAQAEYTTHNIGHFALASPSYLHFTSPIRRYADLMNHRVVKAFLREHGGEAGPKEFKLPHVRESVDGARRCSTRERSVVQAERDVKALFAAMYMRDRIGDRCEGTVSGFSNSGVFVMLDKPPVDGMIRRAQLERQLRETFEMDEFGARWIGTRTGRGIVIGDRVVVEIIDVSIQRRQIDFAWISG